MDAAASKGCNLIVMAWHGVHGFSALRFSAAAYEASLSCKVRLLVHG